MPYGMWDLSSLTRDRTCDPCIGNAESLPLDHQESPLPLFLAAISLPSFVHGEFSPLLSSCDLLLLFLAASIAVGIYSLC